MNSEIGKEDILAYLSQRKGELRKNFQVSSIALFGSFALDLNDEGSDIDILVEFEPDTENLAAKKAEIRSMIEKKFRRKVDLCREKFIKPYFRDRILQTAIYV